MSILLRNVLVLATLVLAATLPPAAQAQVPRVVASIQPVGDLVAAVMAGLGTPTVLIPPGSSPHTYALKPSERAAADRAQLLFWIGPDVESGLTKLTKSLPASTRVVTLATQPGMTLLPARSGGDWERRRPAASANPAGGAEVHHDDDHAHGSGLDGHLWLSPDNAKTIVRTAQQQLAAADPQHARQYAANADQAIARIDSLTAQIRAQLAAVQDKPFIVFHDAYQYFEHAFGLHAVGSIVVSPEAMANARRVQQMRDKIRALQVRCVFSEPQFAPQLVQTLVQGTPARIGTLDPLGAPGTPSLEAYADILRRLADNLKTCLAAP